MLISRLRAPARRLFIAAIGSLLALMFLDGIVALRRTASVHRETQGIQDSHRRTQQLLSDVERRVYLISITIREALLDAPSSTSIMYESALVNQKEQIEKQLKALQHQPPTARPGGLFKLESELKGLFDDIQPVIESDPSERAVRSTRFPDVQQALGSQAVNEIAEEISRLTEASHARQLEQLNQSQIQFKADMQKIMAVAFLIGVVIAAVALLGVATRERADRHGAVTERATGQLRSLSTKLMNAQEDERRTISLELQAEVGQVLANLRTDLGSLEALRESQNHFHPQIAKIKSLAEQALQSAREIAARLRPWGLDLDLLSAIRSEARRFSKDSGVRAIVDAKGDVEDIPDEYRTCIYRVVQECLANAVTHAGANSVCIEIHETNRILHIAVRDDGCAFDRSEGAQRSLSILGMETRVRELRGSLKIEAQPDGGTCMSVDLTLPKKAAKLT